MIQDAASPHSSRRIIATAMILLMVLVFVGVFLFFINRFVLRLTPVGNDPAIIEYGSEYTEQGSTAALYGTILWKDGLKLDIPVTCVNDITSEKVGKYTVKYQASFLWFSGAAERTVRIVDTVSPVITLVPDPADIRPEPQYHEAGFSATDNYDGDITDRVVRYESPDKITYVVVDSSGNSASAERPIPAYDNTPPEITLVGGNHIICSVGDFYTEPGFTAADNVDGDLTDEVAVEAPEEPISRFHVGNYTFTYLVSDSNGNLGRAVRTVEYRPYPQPVPIYPAPKTIYLTFDDGPCPDTLRLLGILKKYNVKATFFVVNSGYPELLSEIVQEGHSIGIHSASHRYREIYENEEAYFADIESMQTIIKEAAGCETWLLRFPGGSSNTISSFNEGIMSLLTADVTNAGYSYFDWNVDSDDAGKAHTPEAVLRNVKAGVLNQPYAVVLMHDIHPYTVDAVESIILWGLENGYTFAPLQTDSPPVHHPIQN